MICLDWRSLVGLSPEAATGRETGSASRRGPRALRMLDMGCAEVWGTLTQGRSAHKLKKEAMRDFLRQKEEKKEP